MAVRAKRGEKSLYDIMLNEHRSNIIKLCEEPKSLIEIEKALGIGHGTALYHVGMLKKEGIVSTKRKGTKTLVKTSFEGFKSKLSKDDLRLEKKNKNLSIKLLKYFLEIQKEGFAAMSPAIAIKFKDIDPFDVMRILRYLELKRLVGLTITEEGKKFLKENELTPP